MIKKYFLNTRRYLLKQKLFTAINIFGLAVGLAGSLLVSAFVWNEISYESMHKNGDRIYRIAVQFGKSDNSMILAGAMPALGEAAKEELPEVVDYARVRAEQNAVITIDGKQFKEKHLLYSDPSVLTLFDINTIHKYSDTLLSEPNEALLSNLAVQKYFSTQNVLGKTFLFHDRAIKISGIFKAIRGNTQIDPDVIISYKTYEEISPNQHPWGSFGQDITYLLLNKPEPNKTIEQKITALVARHTSAQFVDMFRFIPERLPEIYLNSQTIGDIGPHGNKGYVYLFSTIAFFVLFIASLNFINLSTARSFKRSREVGIKKVMGATRAQLVFQFLSESFIITFTALLIGLVLFELFFPALVNYLGIESGIEFVTMPQFYLFLLGILITVGLFAGFYPALFLTRFNPIKTVKNEAGNQGRGMGFRKLLVVVQFAVSILLIFGTTVIYQQLQYLKNYDVGIDKDNIILLNYHPKNEAAESKYETLKNRLLSSSDITDVTGVYTLPGLNNVEKQTLKLEGAAEEDQKIMRFNGVDYSFLKTFKLKLMAGRNFDQQKATDRRQAVILNQTAVTDLGLTPEKAIGRHVIIPSAENENTPARIIGVVKDFNIESLRNNIDPVVLYINPQRFYTIAVRLNPRQSKAALTFIEKTWSEVLPGEEFHYSYLKDVYNGLYSTEEKTSLIFTIFSFLAIFIAALGLLGLASSSAEQRRKEIGIRKVLGSTVGGVVGLLSIDYLKLIFFAAVFTFPVAFVLMSHWLNDFAYRVMIGFLPFFLSGFLTFLIALATVSFQALRAATRNPVESIRYE